MGIPICNAPAPDEAHGLDVVNANIVGTVYIVVNDYFSARLSI